MRFLLLSSPPPQYYNGSMVGLRKDTVASLAGFILLVLVLALNTYYNHSVRLVGDEYMYMKSARALLEGELTLDYPLYDTLKARFPDLDNALTQAIVNPDGDLVSWYTVGITLVLAPLVALLGDSVHWVVPLLWQLAIVVGLYLLALRYFGRSFSPSAHRWPLALFCVALYGAVINFRLGIRRDILCAGLIGFLSAILVSDEQRRRWRVWHIANAIVSLCIIIKVTYILLYLPLGVLFLGTSGLHRRPRKELLVNGLGALAVTLLIFTPMFIHNHACTGHWFLPTQYREARGFVTASESRWSYLLGNTMTLAKTLARAYSPGRLPRWFAVVFVALGAFGLWRGRKQEYVRWWVVPFLVSQLLFLMTTKRKEYAYNVYLTPTYLLTTLMAARGAAELILATPLLSGLRSRGPAAPRALWFAAFLALAPVVAVKGYRSLPGHRHDRFGIDRARRLISDIERIVPPGGVLLCDRFLADPIDYLSHFDCFPPRRLGTTDSSFIRRVGFLLERGTPLYYANYNGIEWGGYYQAVLQRSHDLVLMKGNQCLCGFPSTGGVESFDIYAIKPRRREPRPGRVRVPGGH